MLKYICTALIAMMIALVAGPANATNDQPDADNKPVTFCHYAGSNDHGGSGNYVKLTTNVAAFYNAGHISHTNDIWEAFSYTTKGGDVINVPAQGATSLLAFEDCQKPAELVKVAKPEDVFVDKCGTVNDVFSVAPGRGYTVGAIQTDGVIQSITVTLNEGFTWTDETTAPVRFEHPAFTNVDCNIPNTGAAETGKTAGLIAIAGFVLIGTMTLFGSRRRSSLI